MSVTPEKHPPRKSTAAIVASPTNNEPILGKSQNWKINLNMKDHKLQRPIIIMMIKGQNIPKKIDHCQPLNMQIVWFKIHHFSNI